MKKPKIKAPKYTIKDFQRDFPNDDACLEWLKNHLFPNGITCKLCKRVTAHYKDAKRRSYSCACCGHHVHPTAETIYHKSPTPLSYWFHATYLLTASKNGVAAKELQRQLGVTYKCAWRMAHQIRKTMGEPSIKMRGQVEIDETYVGGKRHGKRGRGADGKTPVFGMVEREGNVKAAVVENVRAKTVMPMVKETVEKGSTIMSDEFRTYYTVKCAGYDHAQVNHSVKEFVRGSAHTNTIEGFWSQLKRSLHGTHHWVSAKHLQKYVNEFAFRYNRRKSPLPMFYHVLRQLAGQNA